MAASADSATSSTATISTTPATTVRAGRPARTGNPKPPDRSGDGQGGDPRAFAAAGLADLGSAGIRVPFFTNSIRFAGNGRKAAHDRSGRRGSAGWAFISAACAIMAMLRVSKLRAKKCRRSLTVEMFDTLGREFKRIGFRFVAVDVDGYRTGALNEVLTTIQVPSDESTRYRIRWPRARDRRHDCARIQRLSRSMQLRETEALRLRRRIVPIAADDIGTPGICAARTKIDLTFVGPEVPLSLGIVDLFRQGRTEDRRAERREHAQLESSKTHAKRFFKANDIPTADFWRMRHGTGAPIAARRRRRSDRRQGRRPCGRKGCGHRGRRSIRREPPFSDFMEDRTHG